MPNVMLDHKHLFVRATLKNPPMRTEFLKSWLLDLVVAADMKVFFGPFTKECNTPGNEGITGIVCIETSHISVHVWNKCVPAIMHLDVYSCKSFDKQIILDKLNIFNPLHYNFKIMDRNTTIKIIDEGEFNI